MFPINEQFAGFFKSFQPANNIFVDANKNFDSSTGQPPAASQNIFSGNELFKDALKTSIETQLAFLSVISANIFASSAKFIELNMDAAKVSVEESEVIGKQLLASKTAQEFMTLVAALPQPTSVKAAAYSLHLAEIASSARAEFARATEEQLALSGRKLVAIVDDIGKGLPAGSESTIAVAKSAIASTQANYEQFNKKSEEAVRLIEVNITNAVNKMSEAAGQAATATARKL